MTTDSAPQQRLLVGTYPASGEPGSGEGIWSLDLDLDSGELSGARQLVEAVSPSFLALSPDRDVVVAVSETSQGRVRTFAVEGDALVATSDASTGGEDPCHLVVGRGDVLVANYSTGSLAVLPTSADGRLGGSVATFAHTGSGPVRDRQRSPHAHFVLEVSERFVWVSDLGTDEIRRYRRTSTPGVLVADGVAVTFPPGTGPRHIALGADGTAFVVGELDSQVHVVRTASDGSGVLVASFPACSTPATEKGSFPSHIALSQDGTRLYVAVRGPDVLAAFAVEAGDGEVPVVRHLADSPSGVVWPRHHAVLTSSAARVEGEEPDGGPVSDLVVVAGQTSGDVTALRVDRETGIADLVSSVPLPAPACIMAV